MTTKQHPLVRESLRWTFVAFFKDGTRIIQGQDDKSVSKEHGSTFTDVLARQDELSSFELNHVNGAETVALDLDTGAFVVNGTPLVIHEQNFEPSEHKLRLIYFRETRVDQQRNTTGEVIDERHYTNRYFLGWQTTVNGKNNKVTLAVG